MAEQPSSGDEPELDYPIEIRLDDMSLSIDGDLLISGPEALEVRRLLATHPELYPTLVVPFIRRRERSFRPSELWIDPKGRIHITNRRLVARMHEHLSGHLRRRGAKGER